jgi:hypothetical protein
MKNKRGELTTKQLVTIIILIVSFAIVLFILFRLNLGETTNKEICHNSVVLRGQSKLTSGPLDCRTNYLCISGGTGCPGIPVTSEVKVDPNDEKEIMKALADEMSDCWWMFGEGKIDYVGEGAFEKVACSICSIVEFDEKFKGVDQITYQEFYDYLRTTQKTNSQTYLQYLYSTNTLDDFREGFNPGNYLENNLEFDKTYFILTGETKGGVLSPRWKFWKTEFIPQPVVILERKEENYDKVGCDEFITKS